MQMDRIAFENSLLHPIDTWLGKSKEEIRRLLGDETARMAGYDQHNPHHCYSLLEHSLRTVDFLPENVSCLLRAAAFFHDIGKPASAKEKEGRLVFYGHALESARIAQKLLEELGYSAKEKNEICFYISHHDDFIPFRAPEEVLGAGNPHLKIISRNNIRDHLKKYETEIREWNPPSVRTVWENLFLLCRSDIKAQAETVYQNGKIVNSRNKKLKKLDFIQKTAEEYWDEAEGEKCK